MLVGSDLPDITPSSIADAISHLRRDPQSLVLGPAQDGGYYLIAATHDAECVRRNRVGQPSRSRADASSGRDEGLCASSCSTHSTT